MGFVASVNFYLALFIDCLKQVRQGRIWLLMAVWFFVLWLVLFAHYKFYSPFFLGVIQPWVQMIHQPNAIGFIHYPGHFLTLPFFFGWARFLVALPIEGAVLGALTVMFYEGYLGRRTAEPASRQKLLFIWLQVTIVWIIINGLIMGVNAWLPELLSSELERSPRRIFVFRYMLQPSLIIGLRGILFFAIPLTVISRVNVLRGLVNSLVLFWRNWFTCLLIAAAVSIVPIGISIIVQNLTLEPGGLRPELIYWFLLAGLVADFLLYYFWIGTAARILVERE